MENNNINFDPMTGQPINQVNNTTVSNQIPTQNIQQNTTPIPIVPTETGVKEQPIPNSQNIQQVTPVDNIINTQQQMQNIPNVEQSKQEFINNTQANNTLKKDETNNGPNIIFIVVLFIIIFAAIFFLFPYLLKVL